ncbi:ribosome maturation factor RimM [Occallatibacter savannae]|uniref:ribosome maturation factor RimM n=1 Tax=Occallatibacter savannae TaxID=1002691 RepID=UPI001EF558C8|nr:ribosome maturation factor RimM [Occallatibacter savannae]
MASEGWVWLARIKRTQGRKGEVFAEVLTDFPEKFAERRKLWLLKSSSAAASDISADAQEITLQHHWMHKGGVVLHFAGIDSISAAEQLAGCVVAIPRSERARLDEGDVYIGDLIGCTLIDVVRSEPVLIGVIEDVDRSAGPVPMLVIRPELHDRKSPSAKAAGDEILIPFAKDYLRRVDIESKRIEMALPEGLVDLNRPDA